MVKTNGAEFRQYYNDPAAWPGSDGETWHEDAEIRVNGLEVDDLDTIEDTDKISISGGVVLNQNWEGKEPSMEAHFKRWKQRQNTVYLVFSCPKDKLDSVQAAIVAAGGKVS